MMDLSKDPVEINVFPEESISTNDEEILAYLHQKKKLKLKNNQNLNSTNSLYNCLIELKNETVNFAERWTEETIHDFLKQFAYNNRTNIESKLYDLFNLSFDDLLCEINCEESTIMQAVLFCLSCNWSLSVVIKDTVFEFNVENLCQCFFIDRMTCAEKRDSVIFVDKNYMFQMTTDYIKRGKLAGYKKKIVFDHEWPVVKYMSL
jgi:hypothetical protein